MESDAERPADPTSPLLARLGEETMRLAWGERGPEERRRIVLAALIFGRAFEERSRTLGPSPDEREIQRLLMGLMSAVVREFAESEGIAESEAAERIGDVRTRDLILEFDEVLAASRASGLSLDEALREAVRVRPERAIWSDHWSSG